MKLRSKTKCLFQTVVTHQRPRLAFQKVSRFTGGIYREAGLFLTTPFTEGCEGVNYQTLLPGRSNMLYF